MNKNINLANGITLFRLLLIVPIVYFLFTDFKITVLTLYLLFAFLDILDGYFARRLKCETKFGKLFDFITDSIAGGIIGLILLVKGVIPFIYVLLVALPIAFYFVNVVRTILITGTFVNSKWKKVTGFSFYFILFLFLLNIPIAIFFAYLILAYYCVASVKYFFEVNKLKKRYK